MRQIFRFFLLFSGSPTKCSYLMTHYYAVKKHVANLLQHSSLKILSSFTWCCLENVFSVKPFIILPWNSHSRQKQNNLYTHTQRRLLLGCFCCSKLWKIIFHIAKRGESRQNYFHSCSIWTPSAPLIFSATHHWVSLPCSLSATVYGSVSCSKTLKHVAWELNH